MLRMLLTLIYNNIVIFLKNPVEIYETYAQKLDKEILGILYMAISPIIVYALLGALLALFLMYLDTKISDSPKTKTTYLKGMSMAAVITAFAVWLAGVDTLPGFGSKYLPAVDDEIFTGMPDF
jgi:hypothetical protein